MIRDVSNVKLRAIQHLSVCLRSGYLSTRVYDSSIILLYTYCKMLVNKFGAKNQLRSH